MTRHPDQWQPDSAASFRVLAASSEDERREWLRVWTRIQGEPQAHPAYALGMRSPGSTSMCAVMQTPGGTVLMPFEVRAIPGELSRDHADAITPYGYGGAYLHGIVEPEEFWTAWDSWAMTAGIVGITVRSHLFNDDVLPVQGDEFSPLENVVVDVARSPDVQWSSVEGRVRTDYRRAEREGVKIHVDEDCSGLEDFLRIYEHTMRMKGAEDFYFFDRESLGIMIRDLGSRVVIFHAVANGRIVASELNLLGVDRAYYFLSGATSEARTVRANPRMKVEVMRWLHDRGFSHYVLGGGMARDDSLFRYKKSYSPKGIYPFRVQYHVVMADVARELEEKRRHLEPGWTPDPNYFPSYRSPSRRESAK